MIVDRRSILPHPQSFHWFPYNSSQALLCRTLDEFGRVSSLSSARSAATEKDRNVEKTRGTHTLSAAKSRV